jgi:hypothetical protein
MDSERSASAVRLLGSQTQRLWFQDTKELWAKAHIWSSMQFRLVGHPDLESQVPKVFAADPKNGPVAVARIRALLESFDDDATWLDPAPVAQQRWTQPVMLNVSRDEVRAGAVQAHVTIYIYEAWSLRFAIARVLLPGESVVGALLMVESQAAAATGVASQNLSLALLAKVEELLWPI